MLCSSVGSEVKVSRLRSFISQENFASAPGYPGFLGGELRETGRDLIGSAALNTQGGLPSALELRTLFHKVY